MLWPSVTFIQTTAILQSNILQDAIRQSTILAKLAAREYITLLLTRNRRDAIQGVRITNIQFQGF